MPRSSTDPSAKRRRPTKDGILADAAKVFAERGFAATPLRDLIRACGCSTTAFYARFDSKEAVLAALIGDLIDELRQAALRELPRARSVEEGYAIGIDVLRAQLRGKRGLWRVALTEGAHTPATRPLVRDAYAGLATLLAAQLELAVSSGPIRRDEVGPRAWAIVGTLSMHLTRWAVFEELTQTELVAVLEDAAATLLPRARPS